MKFIKMQYILENEDGEFLSDETEIKTPEQMNEGDKEKVEQKYEQSSEEREAILKENQERVERAKIEVEQEKEEKKSILQKIRARLGLSGDEHDLPEANGAHS